MTTPNEQILAEFEKGYKKALTTNEYSDKEEFDTWEDGAALEWSKKFLLSHLEAARQEGRDEMKVLMDNVCTTGRNFPARCYECGNKHASGLSWEEAYKANALFAKCFECVSREAAARSPRV